jgi:hypothetical protein
MVLVGLLFVAAIYPVVMSLWHPSRSDDTGDTMMMSLYFTLGVFSLVAVRQPSAHRSRNQSSRCRQPVHRLLGLLPPI